jgi:hypothetical protein
LPRSTSSATVSVMARLQGRDDFAWGLQADSRAISPSVAAGVDPPLVAGEVMLLAAVEVNRPRLPSSDVKPLIATRRGDDLARRSEHDSCTGKKKPGGAGQRPEPPRGWLGAGDRSPRAEPTATATFVTGCSIHEISHTTTPVDPEYLGFDPI